MFLRPCAKLKKHIKQFNFGIGVPKHLNTTRQLTNFCSKKLLHPTVSRRGVDPNYILSDPEGAFSNCFNIKRNKSSKFNKFKKTQNLYIATKSSNSNVLWFLKTFWQQFSVQTGGRIRIHNLLCTFYLLRYFPRICEKVTATKYPFPSFK